MRKSTPAGPSDPSYNSELSGPPNTIRVRPYPRYMSRVSDLEIQIEQANRRINYIFYVCWVVLSCFMGLHAASMIGLASSWPILISSTALGGMLGLGAIKLKDLALGAYSYFKSCYTSWACNHYTAESISHIDNPNEIAALKYGVEANEWSGYLANFTRYQTYLHPVATKAGETFATIANHRYASDSDGEIIRVINSL